MSESPNKKALHSAQKSSPTQGDQPDALAHDDGYDDGIGELWALIENRSSQDVQRIEEAYHFSRKAHQGQMRKSGDPYIVHPVAVAVILAKLEMDTVSIMAGLLHDTVEDVDWVTLDVVKEQFGEEVVKIVEGETKISKLAKKGSQHAQIADEGRDINAENMRQMLIAMLEDPRVILVKLADRLHNMRTMESMKPEKQQRISRETMEIFAPIAHRLGIGQLKWELEDLSFQYLYPKEYQDLRDRLNNRREEREAVIAAAKSQLLNALHDASELEIWVSDIQISGRSKHLWSIYNKIQKEEKTLEQIFDLLAVRIILDVKPMKLREGMNQEDARKAMKARENQVCYHVLSMIHTLWTPLPGRFKDYIAIPKSNGYQSLHTTVISPTGQPIEVQIRSSKMHEMAEYGFAAHWMYKSSAKSGNMSHEIQFFSQAREMKEAIKDPTDYLDALKNDFLSSRVVVFTPKGQAISLARGSTALDFAFHIHTEIGGTASGALVNNKITSLKTKLKFGDVVQIMTSKQSKPTPDWLEWVVTSSARAKISHWLKQADRQSLLEKGKVDLESHLRKHGFAFKKLMRTESLERVAKELINSSNIDDLYLAISNKRVRITSVVKALVPELKEEPKKPSKTKAKKPDTEKPEKRVVYIEGITGPTPTTFSLCCSPWRGDKIMGYITRGRGISIHRADCKNMLRLMEIEADRCVLASWTPHSEEHCDVFLDIVAEDRSGLLSDALQVLSQHGISPNQVEAGITSDDRAHIYLNVVAQTQQQLDTIKKALLDIRSVQAVRRIERIPRQKR